MSEYTNLPDNTLETRLADAKKQVLELTEETKRREQFTPAERLADRLHRLLHYGIDCDYYYSEWPNATGCRHEFRTLATRVLDATNPETVVSLLERQKYGQ